MGYNSTIVVMNDCLHQIENDPDFGKHLSSAVAEHWGERNRGYTSFRHNSMVIAQHHSSVVSLNLVGGNMGKMIGFTSATGGSCHDQENAIKVLKDVAESFGLKLVKMSEREKKNKPWLEPYKGAGCLW